MTGKLKETLQLISFFLLWPCYLLANFILQWLKKWIKKCNDDSETSNWISANTKVCFLVVTICQENEMYAELLFTQTSGKLHYQPKGILLVCNMSSLLSCKVVHTARAYLSFCNYEYCYSPRTWQVTLSILYGPLQSSYSWVRRIAARLKCLSQEHKRICAVVKPNSKTLIPE